MTYTVHYTDLNQPPIQIEEATKDNSTDLTLFGRLRLEYGKELNENILHILENFACEEAVGSTLNNATPDYTKNGNSLSLPSAGQIWYNSSRKLLYYWNGTKWYPLGSRGNYSANWGMINDGQQIPKPINAYTGEAYDYSECIWVVTPASVPKAYTYMVCTTDNQAVVNMKYRGYGESTLTSGTANFLIISIKGNTNLGTLISEQTPAISPSPTPTPTATNQPTPTPTPLPTSTPVASSTPVVSATPSSTPAPTHSKTPAPSHSSTPAPTHSRTPTPQPSPSAPSVCDRCTAQGDNCCVAIESFLPDGRTAGQVEIGDELFLADETTLEPFRDTVSFSKPSLEESVRIITKNGAVLDCSLTAPIPTKEGIVLAPNVLGKLVAVNINDEAYWDEVVEVKELGEIWVQKITVNNKSFWAGKYKNAYILHHNIKCCDCGDSNCIWVGPNCCSCL